MESLTDEQRADRIRALSTELRTYEIYDQDDRAAEVRDELDRLGASAETPHKRAAKRAKSSKKHTEL